MADNGLTLRSAGSALTPDQLDGNFTYLNDKIDAVEAKVEAELNSDGTLKYPQVYYAASATGNDDYAVTLSPVPASYTALIGKLILLKVDVANTNELATLNCNGIGPKSIRKEGETELAAADIHALEIVGLVYDGTNFQKIK